MRGIGSTSSRSPRPAIWLAGAALMAGMVSPQASAQAAVQIDEVAMAVPRLVTRGQAVDGEGAGLPQPLGPAALAVFRRNFLLASRAGCRTQPAFAVASNIPPALADGLMGHVFARYATRCPGFVSVTDLRAWLDRNASLPGADAILAILRRRDPHGKPPATITRIAEVTVQSVPVPVPPPHTRAGRVSPVALRLAAQARESFVANHDERALAQATSAAALAPAYGYARFIAGLAAWRLGRSAPALRHFAAAAEAPDADAATRAAGAYWAARASLAAGDPAHWRGWLKLAAQHRRCFYGLIAQRMLGRSDQLDFTPELLGEADGAAIAETPGGLRAFALLQLDQEALAAAELRRLAAIQPKLTRSIMLVAERAGLFDVAANLADALDQSGDYASAADLFPVPALRPERGFQLDPALVYAIARVESNFDPTAVSHEGARGLMQLMPRTADAVGGRSNRLTDAAINLDLGQRYLDLLAEQASVQGNLLRVLASYNAGPGSCATWCGRVRDFNDPLLFLEAIPVEETRHFVKRVLTATWIYADRFHLAAPSLDALVAGRYPSFSTPRARLLQQVALH